MPMQLRSQKTVNFVNWNMNGKYLNAKEGRTTNKDNIVTVENTFYLCEMIRLLYYS